MPVEVTFNWEQEGYGGDRSEMSFHVSGVASAQAAAVASGPPYGQVPQLNSQHPHNSLHKAEWPFARRVGFGMWEVFVRFSVPEGGGDHPDPGGNPLLAPWEVEWTQNVTAEQVDRDVYGNPILNAARDAFNEPSTRNVTNWCLTIFRNEPFYNWATARHFQDKINSNEFRIAPGSKQEVVFHPGSVKCLGVLPTGRFTIDAQYVNVAYRFEMREFAPNTPVDHRTIANSPFHLHLLNQGYRAWYSDNGTNKLSDLYTGTSGSMDRVGFPVRLKLDGTPVPTDVKVTCAGSAAVPLQPLRGQQPGQIGSRVVGSGTDEECSFLIYQNCTASDFSLLRL